MAIERAAEYAAEDADVTLRLHEHAAIPQSAADDKLATSIESIELPVRDVLFRMERTGMLIDGALLAAQGRALGERVMALEQQAFQAAGAAVQPRLAEAARAKSCSTG